MVYMFLAEGFEEIEAIAPLDILRRADIDVVTVGIGNNVVTGAHGITLATTIVDADLNGSDFDMLVFPGGIPGSVNLAKSQVVTNMLKRAVENRKYIAAICAAPAMVLGKKGVLQGKKAVCFPGYENYLEGAVFTDENVVVDGNVVTAKAAGVALEFGFTLVTLLKNEETAKKIKASMQCPDLI